MTAPASAFRPRKRTKAERVPKSLAAWFAAGGPPPLLALIFPDDILLSGRWRAWKASHPRAKPPENFEWLDDPTSPRHPTESQLAEVRKMDLVDMS